MKIQKHGKITVAISIMMLSFALFMSSLTFAQGWGGPRGMKAGGNGWNQQAFDNRQAFRTEMYNARVQLLASVTDESPETIKAKLRYKPMWAILDEYKVDYAGFSKQMAAKRTEVIKKAVADGKITQEHADFMLERNADEMGPGPRGHGFGYGQRGTKGGPGFRGDCPRF